MIRARQYLAAMTHWEVFLSQAYQAHCLLDMGQKNMFTRGDGSVLERLSLLYGRAKHVEKAVTTAGQLRESGTLPVWLTNDGLRSTDGPRHLNQDLPAVRWGTVPGTFRRNDLAAASSRGPVRSLPREVQRGPVTAARCASRKACSTGLAVSARAAS